MTQLSKETNEGDCIHENLAKMLYTTATQFGTKIPAPAVSLVTTPQKHRLLSAPRPLVLFRVPQRPNVGSGGFSDMRTTARRASFPSPQSAGTRAASRALSSRRLARLAALQCA